MDLSGKVIVITGGSGLLGTSFCRGVAKSHGIVIIADINLSSAETLAAKINNEIGEVRAYPFTLDITDKNSVEELVINLHQKFGKIDALVNNAYPRNKNYGREFFDVAYDDFCENIDNHLGGYFLTSQQFALYFRNQGFGNIVNIASIYGLIAPRFDIYEGTGMTMPVEYAFIKAGIINFTRYLASYLKGHHIKVNSISPGGIRNNQPPLFLEKYKGYCNDKGMLDPEDITGTLVFLLSEESTYVNGQNIVVDDGFSS